MNDEPGVEDGIHSMNWPDAMRMPRVKDHQLVEFCRDGFNQRALLVGFIGTVFRKIAKHFWPSNEGFPAGEASPFPMGKGINKAQGAVGNVGVEVLKTSIGIGTQPGVGNHLASIGFSPESGEVGKEFGKQGSRKKRGCRGSKKPVLTGDAPVVPAESGGVRPKRASEGLIEVVPELLCLRKKALGSRPGGERRGGEFNRMGFRSHGVASYHELGGIERAGLGLIDDSSLTKFEIRRKIGLQFIFDLICQVIFVILPPHESTFDGFIPPLFSSSSLRPPGPGRSECEDGGCRHSESSGSEARSSDPD
jgi:hypothetical protein